MKSQISVNTVHNKDARDILKVIPKGIKVRTTITSPPYYDMKDYDSDNQIGYGQSYEDYLSDLQSIFGDIYKITEDDGSLWIIIDTFKRNNQVVTLPFDLSDYGFLDKQKQKGDFLAYFRSFLMKKDPKWKMVYAHFENFTNGKCTFAEVNVDLCRKFREYLLNVNQLKYPKKKLERNSAAGYYSTFRGLLKIAYRDKMIKENVNDFLEKIEYKDVKKEYLTAEELGLLANTPCEIAVLKSASLFACLTGLRISDILQLEWKHVVPASDGGYCMRIRTEKTETETTLPISDEAMELCGERGSDKVFVGLERSMIQHPLKKWLKQAGIEKHITFHYARHRNFSSQLKTSLLQGCFT